MSVPTATIATCYGSVTQDVIARAAIIRVLICDVDGVLSDGLIYMGNHGEELKAFNVRDGYGIRCLITQEIPVAVITGRHSQLVADRAATLGIVHLYQGQSDKCLAFINILNELALMPHQAAYIGDDLIDWPVMEQVGLSIAVADAHPLLRNRADYITHLHGGQGAVREVCDLILFAQNKLDIALGLSI